MEPVQESDRFSFHRVVQEAAHGDKTMHDLLIALAFIGVVVAPAVYTARFSANIPVEATEK